MSARAIRTVFAAPFVLTAACGKSEQKPAPAPAPRTALLLEITIAEHGSMCVVAESCPKDVACDPAKPYLFDCESTFRPKGDGPNTLGVIDGVCYPRPASCREASCFDKKPTPCPYQELPPLRVAYWAVERLGDECEITPRGLAGNPDGAMKKVACAEGYAWPIVGVYRDDAKRCRVLEYVPRPRPPGSTWNPPEPRFVPCPAG